MTKPEPFTLADFYDAAGVEGDHALWASKITLPFKPYHHQIENLKAALHYDRFGDYSEPATGKTLTSQAWAIHWASYGNRVVFIMPPSLTEQFNRSLRTNYRGFDNHFKTHILKQPPKKRAKLFDAWDKGNDWPDIIIMSYEMFRLTWRDLMDRGGYRLLGADEGHKLKNSESQQNMAVRAFLGNELTESGLLLMTGTPIPNTLEDCYGMIRMVTPGVYRNRDEFDRKHVIYAKRRKPPRPGQRIGDTYLIVDGFRGRNLLHSNLYLQARRVLKDETFNLHKPLIMELDVELAPAHRKLYTKLVKERILLLEEELIDATSAQSLRQKCLRMVANPDRFSDAEKPLDNLVLQAVRDKLEQIGDTEKVVLVAHFRETIELLAREFTEYNPALLYGGTKGSAQKQIDKFVLDETCMMAIIHPESGGVGVDGFQHVCRYMIYVEPTSVPGQFIQTTERLVRPGQEHVVTVWILKVAGTVSPELTRNMFRKALDAQQVTRDKTTMLSELLGDLPQ